MVYLRTSGKPSAPELVAPSLLSQANPTQNIWYTLADLVGAYVIHAVVLEIATTTENVELEITIDGKTFTATATYTNDTSYYPRLYISTAGYWIYTTPTNDSSLDSDFCVCNFQFKFRIRKTTATGTGTLSGGLEKSRF